MIRVLYLHKLSSGRFIHSTIQSISDAACNGPPFITKLYPATMSGYYATRINFREHTRWKPVRATDPYIFPAVTGHSSVSLPKI